MEVAPITCIVEMEDEFTASYVIIQNGEFRSYFCDKVEGIVDVRIYRVNSDETTLYTIHQPL